MTPEQRAERLVKNLVHKGESQLEYEIAAAIREAVEEATEVDRHRIIALIEKQAELMSALAANGGKR